MGIKTWADGNIKKLGYYDIQLIKLSVAGFILMVAKLWPGILSLSWYWYALIFVLAAIRPILKVFGKPSPKPQDVN